MGQSVKTNAVRDFSLKLPGHNTAPYKLGSETALYVNVPPRTAPGPLQANFYFTTFACFASADRLDAHRNSLHAKAFRDAAFLIGKEPEIGVFETLGVRKPLDSIPRVLKARLIYDPKQLLDFQIKVRTLLRGEMPPNIKVSKTPDQIAREIVAFVQTAAATPIATAPASDALATPALTST